jgi:hypothetical protein
MSNETINEITFTRINSDTFGNPRYVFHFLDLADTYSEALFLAKKIGGRKFNNKQYGGGIAIQSYNLEQDSKSIKELATN